MPQPQSPLKRARVPVPIADAGGSPWLTPLLLLAAVAFSRVVSWYSFYLFDDSFITFRYAEHLAGGQGFVYNLGERVQGLSTPVWGIILAVAHALGMGTPLWSRILALVCELGVAALVLARLKREGAARAGVLAIFLFAVDLYLAKTAAGGMESSLFLLATVLAAMWTVQRKYLPAALIAALSVFVRPEGGLLALCLLGYAWHAERRFPWRALLAGSAVVLAGVLLQWSYYGELIPQSVRGKAALPWSLASVWNLALFPLRDPLQAALTLTTVLGLRSAWKRSPLVRVYGIWTGALLAAWIVNGAHLWPWYCVPLWFYKTLVTGVALHAWLESGATRSAFARATKPAVLLAVVLAGWIALALVLGPDRMERNVYARLRAWAQGRDLSGQTAYGMDFGAFGYYSRARIVDEPGLVFPPAISVYNHDLRRMLLGERPEWAFVTRYQQNIHVMRSPELGALYEPVWRASMDGDTALGFDLNTVPEQWRADFVLYRRTTGDR